LRISSLINGDTTQKLSSHLLSCVFWAISLSSLASSVLNQAKRMEVECNIVSKLGK
jgi:hypothetical protein